MLEAGRGHRRDAPKALPNPDARERAARALARVLPHLELREPVGVLLEGSLAEGFGSSRSDIDLTFVVAGGRSAPIMRRTFFDAGLRYEAFIRTESDLAALAEEIEQAARGGSSPDCDRLDDYVKLSRCLPLNSTPRLARLLAGFRFELATALVGALHRRSALDAILGSMALTRCGLAQEASRAARVALASATKASLAARGETYLKEKFLDDQMIRAGEDPGARARFWSLYSPGSGWTPTPYHTLSCTREAALRIDVDPSTADPVVLARHRDSATHAIGHRDLVVVGGTRIFGLGVGAEALWRSIETPAKLDLLLRRRSRDPARARERLCDLVRAGLVEFRAATGCARWSICDGRGGTGLVSPSGAFWRAPRDQSDALVVRFEGDPRQVAESGAELAWQRLLIDNCWEDVRGGYADGRWRRVEAALRKIVRTCAAMLSIATRGGRPSSQEPVASRGGLQDADLADLVNRCARLEPLSVCDRVEADAAISEVGHLVGDLPAPLRWSDLPGTHSSSQALRGWCDVAAGWMRLVRHSGGRAPVAEMLELARNPRGSSESGPLVVDVG